MGFFESCIKCVPPKRHPGCQDHCPDYAKDKAEYNEKKGAENKKRKVHNDIHYQRAEAIVKANKKHRRK